MMRRRRQWVKALGEAAERMLWGSLVPVYRKCGKPTCHCATGEKHGPAWYLSRREEGRTRMWYVPPALLPTVQQGVAAFHRYRAVGQRLAAANLTRVQRQTRRGPRRR
jgi:hypothetical protein